jgi:hypothetical protein
LHLLSRGSTTGRSAIPLCDRVSLYVQAGLFVLSGINRMTGAHHHP